MQLPAILQILAVFACMLGLARARVPLGVALVIGGVSLGFCGGLAPGDVLSVLAKRVLSSEFWLLLIVILLIIEVGRFMTGEENAAELVNAISRIGGRHGRALTAIVAPVVLGLVPMPGGALFSAPFVGRAVEGIRADGPGRLDAGWKTAVNYWFRHVWEYWWPLYPGVIIAIQVFGIQAWRFIAVEFPYTPVALLVGYFILIRPYLREFDLTPSVRETNRGRLLLAVAPLVLVVAGTIGLPNLVLRVRPDLSSNAATGTAMLLSLLGASLLIAAHERRAGARRFMRQVASRKSMSILASVAGVMVFKSLLESSGVVKSACDDLRLWGIAPYIVVAALPFLAGNITGLALGFAGTAFPLVVELVNAPGSGLYPLSTLALAYGFGYMGMMFSPVHICLLVTKDYFSSNLAGVYRRILPCGIAIILFSIITSTILHAFGL